MIWIYSCAYPINRRCGSGGCEEMQVYYVNQAMENGSTSCTGAVLRKWVIHGKSKFAFGRVKYQSFTLSNKKEEEEE